MHPARTAVLAALVCVSRALAGLSSAEVSAAHGKVDPKSCTACHAAEVSAWLGSHHARAQSLPGPDDPAAPAGFGLPAGWIGVSPLRQLLVPAAGGRLQATDLAYDPGRRDWFYVFGADVRKPGEWGHRTGRGMNWNSQCAFCHNTAVSKNYSASSDAYATAVGHAGVTCAACHGASSSPLSAERMEEACAACHARRSELTGRFTPGDSFHDHFSLLTVDESAAFYPDGRVSEEDFEYAAFLGSRMHGAGVRCVDCHEPHGGGLRAEGNALCLRCHSGANPKAPVIMPQAHSHHAVASVGNQCVNCHMPQATYMQRHARRDHGFTVPDPVLTRTTGEPNACGGCHADKDVAWSERAVERWYGKAMERPSRDRALAVAAARQGGTDATALLRLLSSEPGGYWRAVEAGLLAEHAGDDRVARALEAALSDPDPLVRAAAARALGEGGRGSSRPSLQKALLDGSAEVRIEAAWALRDAVDTSSGAGLELLGSLLFNQDQPSGAYRLGVFEMGRGEAGSLVHLENAVRWDPLSAPMRAALALAYGVAGRHADAAAQLVQACRLAPRDASLELQLGLALGENGDPRGSVAALREAVRLDPSLGQAWYNLAVIASQSGDMTEARRCAKEAIRCEPDSVKALRLMQWLIAR